MTYILWKCGCCSSHVNSVVRSLGLVPLPSVPHHHLKLLRLQHGANRRVLLQVDHRVTHQIIDVVNTHSTTTWSYLQSQYVKLLQVAKMFWSENNFYTPRFYNWKLVWFYTMLVYCNYWTSSNIFMLLVTTPWLDIWKTHMVFNYSLPLDINT